MTPVPFRFDADRHVYTALDTGEVLGHITGMLEHTGWIDSTWFTEDSCTRGTAVHALTADYDLGALDFQTCKSAYRGWLAGHVAAVAILKPEMVRIEEPMVHPFYRFGGRPDRVMTLFGLPGVWEVKSRGGGSSVKPDKKTAETHAIQTALQAILAAVDAQLPPEALARYCCYLKDDGKYKVEEHIDKRDFDKAREVIHACCEVAA